MSEDFAHTGATTLSEIASKLRELEKRATGERAHFSSTSESGWEAGFTLLATEVGAAADTAERLANHPGLAGSRA